MGKLPKALLVGCAIAALCACNKANNSTDANSTATTAEANTTSSNPSDPIASATAAAPESIGKDATVIQAAADGSVKTLRAGNNGWTCMPDNPNTPGQDPMCMDANGLKWAQAWMAHKPPPANNVGLMYMLKGGSDASNVDPWGEKPSNGKWVETGPHIMVVGAESLNRLYPANPEPDTKKPYVMFGGTPYAHLMVPIG